MMARFAIPFLPKPADPNHGITEERSPADKNDKRVVLSKLFPGDRKLSGIPYVARFKCNVILRSSQNRETKNCRAEITPFVEYIRKENTFYVNSYRNPLADLILW